MFANFVCRAWTDCVFTISFLILLGSTTVLCALLTKRLILGYRVAQIEQSVSDIPRAEMRKETLCERRYISALLKSYEKNIKHRNVQTKYLLRLFVRTVFTVRDHQR